MPDYDIKNYDLNDLEKQGAVFMKFDKKVENLYKKEQNPVVKPEQVFMGYKKPSKNKDKKH